MVDYDLIIVGSGPAGMNACLYATRSKLKTLVIEKSYPGGKIVKANIIENWIGTQSISGSDLALQMFKHSFSYGGIYEQGNVLDIIDYGTYKEVVTESKKYKCYAVIICAGTSEKKLGIIGEEKFYGKGVSYCAICDGLLYKDKTMVVVGNNEYAVKEALYLSKYARKLIFVNNKDELDVDESLMKKIASNEVVELKNYRNLKSINGKEFVESVTLENGEEIETSVVFPLFGSSPDSMFASRLGIVDENKYVIVNERQETKIKGIFAAGDCTAKPLKQIITASGDGAIAAIEAYKYINEVKKKVH